MFGKAMAVCVVLLCSNARAEESEREMKLGPIVKIEGLTKKVTLVKVSFTTPIVAAGYKFGARICEEAQSEIKLVRVRDAKGKAEAATVVAHTDGCAQVSGIMFANFGDGFLDIEFKNGNTATLSLLVAELLQVKNEVVLFAKSEAGVSISVAIKSPKLTTDVAQAVVCMNGLEPLVEFKLFMVEHGHGSSPTAVSALADGCFQVDDIEFTMPGKWQLRMTIGEEDSATLNVNVVRILKR